MRFLTIIIIWCLAGCVTSPEKEPLDNIRPEIALKAVNQFRLDPISEDAMGYLSVVANFASQSDEVYVVIDEEFFPADFTRIKGVSKRRLLGAYVAGNIEMQLLAGIKENQALSGVRLMLFTYEAMKQARILESLSGFEEYLALDKRRELTF